MAHLKGESFRPYLQTMSEFSGQIKQNWIQIWWAALTKPYPGTYRQISHSGRTTRGNAITWIVIATIISALIIEGLELLDFVNSNAGDSYAMNITCLAPIIGVLIAVIFIVKVEATHAISRILGGDVSGDASYAVAAYEAPLIIIGCLLTLVTFNIIFELALIVIVLDIIAAKGTYQFKWHNAAIASIAGFIAVLLFPVLVPVIIVETIVMSTVFIADRGTETISSEVKSMLGKSETFSEEEILESETFSTPIRIRMSRIGASVVIFLASLLVMVAGGVMLSFGLNPVMPDSPIGIFIAVLIIVFRLIGGFILAIGGIFLQITSILNIVHALLGVKSVEISDDSLKSKSVMVPWEDARAIREDTCELWSGQVLFTRLILQYKTGDPDALRELVITNDMEDYKHIKGKMVGLMAN